MKTIEEVENQVKYIKKLIENQHIDNNDYERLKLKLKVLEWVLKD